MKIKTLLAKLLVAIPMIVLIIPFLVVSLAMIICTFPFIVVARLLDEDVLKGSDGDLSTRQSRILELEAALSACRGQWIHSIHAEKNLELLESRIVRSSN